MTDSTEKYEIKTDSLTQAIEQLINQAHKYNRGPLTLRWSLTDGSYVVVKIAKKPVPKPLKKKG